MSFAKAISDAGDNVLVLASATTAPDFLRVLADDQVLTSPAQEDIWIRDYGTVRINKPVRILHTSFVAFIIV